MIAWAALLAACAVGVLVTPGERGRRWLAVAAPARSPSPSWRRVAAVALAMAGVVLAGVVAAGHRGAIIGGVLAILGGAAGVVVWERVQHARARALRAEIAQACAALASVVAAGRVPVDALRDVAEDWAVLQEAWVTASLGGDPAASLLRRAETPGCGGLAALGRAWAVSERTGAPLTDLLDGVAIRLRADADLRHTVQAELSSARATGRLLAGLPLVGLGLGFAFGGNPLAFLLDNPVGWACLLLGSACAAAGVLWNERLADKAEAW